jgi:hypothetical protein
MERNVRGEMSLGGSGGGWNVKAAIFLCHLDPKGVSYPCDWGSVVSTSPQSWDSSVSNSKELVTFSVRSKISWGFNYDYEETCFSVKYLTKQTDGFPPFRMLYSKQSVERFTCRNCYSIKTKVKQKTNLEWSSNGTQHNNLLKIHDYQKAIYSPENHNG